jgi:hypothetical protein
MAFYSSISLVIKIFLYILITVITLVEIMGMPTFLNILTSYIFDIHVVERVQNDNILLLLLVKAAKYLFK